MNETQNAWYWLVVVYVAIIDIVNSFVTTIVFGDCEIDLVCTLSVFVVRQGSRHYI